jgi:hypothetical protein
MKRTLAALVGAALLLGSLPGSVAAARVSKFTDHTVDVSCEQPVDGGYLSAFASTSQQFGSEADLNIWYDPAIPFEEPPDVSGTSQTFDVTETSDGVDVSVDWNLTDADGNALGDGSMAASLTNIGDPYADPAFDNGNHHSATVITHQDMEGSATITVLGVEYEVGCFGTVSDYDVFEASPTSFVSGNAGVRLDCFWENGTTAAGLFAISDEFGFFASAFLVTDTGGEFSLDYTGSFDASSLDATLEMWDDFGNALGDATATASLSPVGDLTTTFLIQQHVRTKLVQQDLAPDGSIEFPTGESFQLDAEHCASDAFDNHTVATAPKGPKPGAPPPNDTPEGTIALDLGASLKVVTTGTAIDPEVGITTCPEGERDDLGHTVWYTFEGTGDPVTIDTSGSNFDTVVAVYTLDGDTWTEVGCEDDQGDAQNPISLQAKLTVPTEAGVTYYVQAGGYRFVFDPESAQAGRLRLAID